MGMSVLGTKVSADLSAMAAQIQQALGVASDAQTKAATAITTADQAQAATSAVQQTTTQQATAITTLQQLADQVTGLNQASVADRAALHAAIDALAARTLSGQVKQVTAAVLVALNATGTVTATWAAPMPSASYVPLLLSPLAISNVTVTSQTAQAVTFSYKAGVAVGLGTAFNVVGLRFG